MSELLASGTVVVVSPENTIARINQATLSQKDGVLMYSLDTIFGLPNGVVYARQVRAIPNTLGWWINFQYKLRKMLP